MCRIKNNYLIFIISYLHISFIPEEYYNQLVKRYPKTLQLILLKNSIISDRRKLIEYKQVTFDLKFNVIDLDHDD